jgi:hypothetical protein
MGTRELEAALKRGEPLIEITVIFCADVYPPAATKRLNALAEDLDFGLRPYYFHNSRKGQATKGALWRIFRWEFNRVPMEWHPGGFWWMAGIGPDLNFAGLETVIEHLGYEQPGAFDEGQPYEWPDTQTDEPPRAGG